MKIHNIAAIAGTEFPAGRRTRVMVGPGAPAESSHFVMGHVTVYPGGAVPHHCHEQEEVYYIERGRGVLRLGQEEHAVAAGDYAYIPPGTEHCLTNTGEENLIMLFCYAPKSIVDHWQKELEGADETK